MMPSVPKHDRVFGMVIFLPSVKKDKHAKCQRSTGWWPDHGIEKLVDEYEFAMELLPEADRIRGLSRH
jgi:hypothetical protein